MSYFKVIITLILPIGALIPIGAVRVRLDFFYSSPLNFLTFDTDSCVLQVKNVKEVWRVHNRNDWRGYNRIVTISKFSKRLEGAFQIWLEGLKQNWYEGS